MDKNWKRRLYRTKCIFCEEIVYELKYKHYKNQIKGRAVEYDAEQNIIGITKDFRLKHPERFITELSISISSVLFASNLPKAKLISSLIEKLLKSEDQINTLRDLGFSTLILESKKYNIPKVKLKIPESVKTFKNLSKDISSIKNLAKANKLVKNPSIKNREGLGWEPKRFFVIDPNSRSQLSGTDGKANPSDKIKTEDKINIILKSPPSRNNLIKYVKERLDQNLDNNDMTTYYNINRNVKKKIKNVDKKLYKSMEFAGRAVYGGLDITPAIPQLILEEKSGIHYYKQDGLAANLTSNLLKKFQEMLEYIVEIIGGDAKSVRIAYFKAPVNAFNYKGQLIFNYFLMHDGSLEIPLFLIWIFIVAHELAHNVSKSHDQLHSKYLMIFAIRGIQNLDSISRKFLDLYNRG
ncbi:MAG: hypothetical protein GF353_07925 [Candidatus Lokiarchaeota archaeon]|nr:hypothetical protein [Candidatus Lokiarchaeota archaeon]